METIFQKALQNSTFATNRSLTCTLCPSSVPRSAALVDDKGRIIAFAIRSDAVEVHSPHKYMHQILEKWPLVEIVITLSSENDDLKFKVHKVQLPRQPRFSLCEPIVNRDNRPFEMHQVPLEYTSTTVVNSLNYNQDIVLGSGEEAFVIPAEDMQKTWEEFSKREKIYISIEPMLQAIEREFTRHSRDREGRWMGSGKGGERAVKGQENAKSE